MNQETLKVINHAVKTGGEYATLVVEIIGVLIILVLSLYAFGYAIYRLVKSENGTAIFHKTRYRLIHGILLGLDFLVAADIIRTAALELTFHSVGVLSIIVAIRIILSFTLEVEMTGYWPWQKSSEKPTE